MQDMRDHYEPILSPVGDGQHEADSSLSPRLASVRGRTAALLDNGKPNGAVLLEEIGNYLTHRHGLADYRLFTKGYFGTPVEEDLVPEIAASSDFVLAAVGD